ncbi:hypothetical protein KRX52_12390 [Pseudomonas sp. MAP12]|uniref:NAD-dependent epimerase/dehydratase domain-containing protein n=1 Tax=Geopseudomonas aromaticivorans TaxID=2849492 RepID=A0ABS6MXP7_9GAMM|nr:NAD-dependent epimerase/dehydratase family protein [Pseudomonas aromaticivorans]MBV2133591.1 hypothetical protein [Pseudomonas aromaticivorans]
MKTLVTGGVGFIGSDMFRHLRSSTGHEFANLDNGKRASTRPRGARNLQIGSRPWRQHGLTGNAPRQRYGWLDHRPASAHG